MLREKKKKQFNLYFTDRQAKHPKYTLINDASKDTYLIEIWPKD